MESLSLEELQHLVSSVFVFEPGLTGGSALYNVPQGMFLFWFFFIDEKAKLKL